jgi:hypothetical protein
MGLFKRSSAPKADPGEVARWRGRSAEIDDAGGMAWEVVMESLTTVPEPEISDDMEMQDVVMAPLGLSFHEDLNRGDGDGATSIFTGVRHGRPVLMNQGSQRSGGKGALVVWVLASTPEMSVRADDGRLAVDGDAPPAIATAVAAIAPQPKLWNDMHLVGGAEGVVIKRPLKTSTHPQAWIYDLWLAERVADLVATAALPEPTWDTTYLPYGLDRSHTW